MSLQSNDVLVLAHGAFHGPWCWQPTIKRLEREGLRCVAVDLNRGGAEPDRVALQGVVDGLRADGFRVHAIGHSLGCISVALLDPDSLATAILLAGPVADGPGMPDSSKMIGEGFLEHLEHFDDGRCLLSRDPARGIFYHRCDPKDAERALDQLRPTFIYGAGPTERVFHEALPVTYIACAEDRAIKPAYQAAVCEQMTYSVTLDFDHSPMLGAPDLLAAAILDAMAR